MKTTLFYLSFQPIHAKYQSIKKIPYNPFGLYGISVIYLLQVILLPQSQHPVHCHCSCLNPDLHCYLPDLR